MSFSDYDKTTRPKVANEDLEQSKFKKTASNKIAVRVGNEADDPLHVAVTEGVGELDLLVFDDASSVSKNTETKIIEYVVPPTKKLNLDKITCSGENVGKYTVKLDGNTLKVLRTYYGGELNAIFEFKSFEISAGSTIEVFIEHFLNDNASTHEATIEGKIV